MEHCSVAHPGAKQESAVIIYQQNPTNVISQQGTNNHISIAESKAIQIGHGNSMLRQLACDQSGKRRAWRGPLLCAWGVYVFTCV